MAVIHIGNITATRLLRQPGSALVIEKNGGARATDYYRCRTSQAQALAAQVQKHPVYPQLKRERATITEEEADISLVVIEFSGYSEPWHIPDGNKEYSMMGTLSTEPIETHPDFATNLAGTPAAPENGCTADSWSKDGRFLGFPSGSPFEGVQSYLMPGLIWQEVWTTRTKPANSYVNALGQIDSPPGGPLTPTGRNWLLISANLSEQGDMWQLTRQWRLSGPGGWSTDIYGS